MKWKKILSVMIVSVLVIAAFTVISGATSAQDEGERVSSIDFGVTLDMEDGAIAAAEGETHIFMHSVDGPIWQGLAPTYKAQLSTWEVFGSYNNWLLNPAHEGWETAEILDAVDQGWIDEAENVRYMANNYDDEWTVNPFAHNDIRFAMQYMSREGLIEDLLLGWGDERYGAMARSLEVWQEYFVDAIEEKYDLSPGGDWSRVEWIVEEAMLEIVDHIEDITEGDMQLYEDNGEWWFEAPEQDAHQIRIEIMARSEDWRLDKGHWTASRLEDLGFDVIVDPTPSHEAIPTAFYGNYDNLEYHIYTGGWISTTSVFYQEVAINQMHMPWYGFMQTFDSPANWNYNQEGFTQTVGPSERVRDHINEATGRDDIYDHMDLTVEEANAQGIDLFDGVESEEAYWEMKVNTMQHGFEESVRVFAVTEVSLYPYNPDRLIVSVPEAINGYDTYFGPRTMRTDDGTLEADILSGVERPYMDNWNLEEGSADVYGEYQRRVAREYGSWSHPQSGLPVQVNTYWMDNDQLAQDKPERTHPYDIDGNIHTDFEFEEGELIEYIDLPMDEAVDYIPAYVADQDLEWDDEDEIWTSSPIYEEVREWKTLEWIKDTEEAVLTTNETILTDPDATEDELIEYVPLNPKIQDEKAAVEARIDVHDEHVWHDGTEFDLRDVMVHYANRRELGHPGTEPYNSGTDLSLSPGWDATYGYVWNLEDGIYTAYGDYTFPMDDKVGNFYAIFPWDAHPITYFAWNELHAEDFYNYVAGEDEAWIHQLIESHSLDMIEKLEEWVDAGELPWYMDVDRMPEAMEDMAYDLSEFEDIVDSFAAFVDETGHSYIGIGPYRIDDYDEADHDMTITLWDDYGYPHAGESVEYDGETYEFPHGYWTEQFEIDTISLDIMELVPEEVLLYDPDEEGEVDIFVDAQYVELFPELVARSVTEEDIDDMFIRLAESERGAPVEIDDEPLEIYKEDIDMEEIGDITQFSSTMDVSDIDASGTYSMEFRIREEEVDPWIVITRDIPIVVEEEVDLTLDVGEGGSVEIDGEVTDPGTYTYPTLSEIELRAVPDEGYSFDQWVGDVPLIDQEDELITVLMDSDKDITATFEELPEYELTINAEEGGTTDPAPGTYTYYEGEEVTVEAIPDEGWFFDEWTGDYESDEEVITFEIMEDMEITANFIDVAPAYFEVEITDYDDEVEEGDTVTVEFTVENTGELEGTQTIVFSVDGDEEDTMEMTIGAGESEDGEFEWEAEDEGEYELEVASDDTSDSVTVTVEEEDEPGIPGFTLGLLVLGAIVAVAIYYKKEQ